MARLVLAAWPVGSGLHLALGASVAGAVTISSADRPQEQAKGRLRLRRRLPARPLYGQV